MNGADVIDRGERANDRRTVEPAELGRGLVIAVERGRGQKQILGVNLRRGERLDGRATSTEVGREERGVETQIQVSRVSARDQLGQDGPERPRSEHAGAVIRSDTGISTSDSDVVISTSDSDVVVTIAGT